MDNATNNGMTGKYLKHCLHLPFYKKLFRVRCCAHILNLIVEDVLQILYESVEKIRTIVCNMNSSRASYEIYKKLLYNCKFEKKKYKC